MHEATQSNSIPLPDKPLDYKLAAGQYHAKVVKSVYANKVLFFGLELTRGEHAGRSVFAVFNLNTSDGRDQFGRFSWAVGKVTPRDSSEFHGLCLLVTIKPTRIDGVSLPLVVKFAKPLVMEVR